MPESPGAIMMRPPDDRPYPPPGGTGGRGSGLQNDSGNASYNNDPFPGNQRSSRHGDAP